MTRIYLTTARTTIEPRRRRARSTRAADARRARAGAHRLPRRPAGRVKALQEGAARTARRSDKPAAAQALQRSAHALEALLAERKIGARRRATAPAQPAEVDLSLPARRQWRGAKHPVTLVIEEIEAIFRELGFTIAQGPEAESEWYNFGALNFPPNHPALDAHDTLYLEGEGLLRTHTSPVQVRTLQKYEPPIRVLIPGNVYRRDFFDASHAPMFAQIEGLCVDEGISFVDLKVDAQPVRRALLRRARKTRFRPSFFPFTEPSAEMDVQCGICGGTRLRGVQGHGLDRDPRLRHGASEGARGGGRRQREVHRLGVRHGPGAHRDQPLWHS